MSLKHPKGIHTSCRTGKRVKIVLRNNETFIAKFKEEKSKQILFLDHIAIDKKEIRFFFILKHKPEN